MEKETYIWKIFYADDDKDDRNFFEHSVKKISPNTSITLAKNGKEMLEILIGSKSKPDLIVLDMNMPCMDGFECLREIRKNKRLLSVPIVMLSTSNSTEHIQRAVAEKADRYYIKPGCLEELFKTVQAMLTLINRKPTYL